MIRRQREAASRGDVHGFSVLDAEFHMELARSSKNTVLQKFLETIWELLNRFIEEVARLTGSIDNAVSFHSRIAACIGSHDPEGAEQEMSRHLYDVVCTIERSTEMDLDTRSLFDLLAKRKGLDIFTDHAT